MKEFEGYRVLLADDEEIDREIVSRIVADLGAECIMAKDPATAKMKVYLFTAEAERLSLSAYADVETAYICRGAIYDTRPFSAQSASLGVDLDPFGIVEPTIWTYSPMSSSGQSARLTHYAYAEVDYLLRYYYLRRRGSVRLVLTGVGGEAERESNGVHTGRTKHAGHD